jgi:predicted secreted hydrolase
MLYQMRLRDGGADPVSSGTFIARDGSTRHLRRDDWQLTPREFWTSKETGGRYPITWEVAVSPLDLKLTVTTTLKDQELVLKPIEYWEGAIDCTGARSGRSVRGHGYLELTGYAGALVGLSN